MPTMVGLIHPDWSPKTEARDLGRDARVARCDDLKMATTPPGMDFRDYGRNRHLFFRIKWRGVRIGYEPGNEAEAAIRLWRATLPIWLARRSKITITDILAVEVKGGEPRTIAIAAPPPPLIPLDQYTTAQLDTADEERAVTMYSALGPGADDGQLTIALTRLHEALRVPLSCERLVKLMIGLEALFAPGGPPPEKDETPTSIFAKRTARFLAQMAGHADAATLVIRIKKMYGPRSDSEHGRHATEGLCAGMLDDAETYLRDALVAILGDANLVTTFSDKKNRSSYLKSLTAS